MEGEFIRVVGGQVFFEGMDCVSMVLDCTLEVGILGVLGGMVLRHGAILVGGCTIFLEVGGSTFPKTTCTVCCRILVIAAFAVSANNCGHNLLLLKPENTNSHGFELHRPSIKGAKLLFKSNHHY